MSDRSRVALVCGVLALAGACRAPRAERGRAPEQEGRQRVLDFWRELDAASRARHDGHVEEAVAGYERALALDPRHEDALYYLGQCLRELGRAAEARAAFERLIAVNETSARGHLALGALLASPDPSEPLDLRAAEVHLRRAHAINGEETGPVVRLGEVLLATGRAREAREWFEAALRTNPKSLEAAFLAGYVSWDGGLGDVRGLLPRVREAAKAVVPVKGVLSEGDRKDERHVVAPPLESPIGRLLFGAPIAALRGRLTAGRDLDEVTLERLWRETRRLKAAVASRAEPSGPSS